MTDDGLVVCWKSLSKNGIMAPWQVRDVELADTPPPLPAFAEGLISGRIGETVESAPLSEADYYQIYHLAFARGSFILTRQPPLNQRKPVIVIIWRSSLHVHGIIRLLRSE